MKKAWTSFTSFLLICSSQISKSSSENCPRLFLGFWYNSTDPYELNNVAESQSHYAKLKPEYSSKKISFLLSCESLDCLLLFFKVSEDSIPS